MSSNSKKSWHPSKVSNQAKVDKLEQEQEEQKRLAELRRQEIAEEKELAELRDRARGSGAPSRPNKISWIYSTETESKDVINQDQLISKPKEEAALETTKTNTGKEADRLAPSKSQQTLNEGARAKLTAADPFAQSAAKKQKKQVNRSDSRVHKRQK